MAEQPASIDELCNPSDGVYTLFSFRGDDYSNCITTRNFGPPKRERDGTYFSLRPPSDTANIVKAQIKPKKVLIALKGVSPELAKSLDVDPLGRYNALRKRGYDAVIQYTNSGLVDSDPINGTKVEFVLLTQSRGVVLGVKPYP